MHQIHGRIGLQQTAPRAFAGVRFPGDQQHAQPVPYAVDFHDSTVVEQGNFAGKRIGGDLDDRGTLACDRHVESLRLADSNTFDNWLVAVATDGHACGLAGILGTQIVHREPQGHGLADDAVPGGFNDADTTVHFLALGGNQHVQWRAVRRGLLVRRDVMHLTIGDRDGAGEPVARDIRQGLTDGAEKTCAGITALRHGDGAQLKARHPRRLTGDRLLGRLGQGGAIADLHGGSLVHDQ